MPNTLCHISLQTPATRLACPRAHFLVIVAACIIPDLPWIFQRIFLAAGIGDPYSLRLYFAAQASLLFCLIPAAMLGIFSRSPLPVFAIAAVNVTFHLLLDSTQIKWANGVHLFAPFSWQPLSFGIVWPEHPFWLVLSAVGIFILAWFFFHPKETTMGRPVVTPSRTALLLILTGCYLITPLAFIGKIEAGNMYCITTLKADNRTGKYLELDRAVYNPTSKSVTTFAGEQIYLEGNVPEQANLVSLQGKFLSQTTLHVTTNHIHTGVRDYASFLGLFMACALFLQSLLLSRKFYDTKPKDQLE